MSANSLTTPQGHNTGRLRCAIFASVRTVTATVFAAEFVTAFVAVIDTIADLVHRDQKHPGTAVVVIVLAYSQREHCHYEVL